MPVHTPSEQIRAPFAVAETASDTVFTDPAQLADSDFLGENTEMLRKVAFELGEMTAAYPILGAKTPEEFIACDMSGKDIADMYRVIEISLENREDSEYFPLDEYYRESTRLFRSFRAQVSWDAGHGVEDRTSALVKTASLLDEAILERLLSYGGDFWKFSLNIDSNLYTWHEGETARLKEKAKELYADDPEKLPAILAKLTERSMGEAPRHTGYWNISSEIGTCSEDILRGGGDNRAVIDMLYENPDVAFILRDLVGLGPVEYDAFIRANADIDLEQLGDNARLLLREEIVGGFYAISTYCREFGKSETQDIIRQFGIYSFSRYDPEVLHQQYGMMQSGVIDAEHIVFVTRGDSNGVIGDDRNGIMAQFKDVRAVFFEINSPDDIEQYVSLLSQMDVTQHRLQFTIAGHGTENVIATGGEPITLSSKLFPGGKKLEDYFPGKEILCNIDACLTGAGKHIGTADETWSEGMAAHVANELGVTVRAATANTIGVIDLGGDINQAPVFGYGDAGEPLQHSTHYATLTVFPRSEGRTEPATARKLRAADMMAKLKMISAKTKR
jgi:hypothetical protein